MRSLPLWLLVLLAAACGTVGPSGTPCEIGRSQPCACVGGGSGAQECSLAGIYEACRCSSADAGPDVADVAAVADARADVTPDRAAASDDTQDAASTDASDASIYCDADLTSDPANCGACGRVCASMPAIHVGAGCGSGLCVQGGCTMGFADCDGNGNGNNTANGCEVNANSDPANCGGCRRACSSGHCTAGRCTAT